MKIKAFLIGTAIMALSACTSLSTAGNEVRVTSNPEAIKGAKYISTIHKRSIVGGLIADSSKDALTKIRNEAAELGGGMLFISSVSQVGIFPESLSPRKFIKK